MYVANIYLNKFDKNYVFTNLSYNSGAIGT